MAERLTEIAKVQEVGIAGLDSQLAEYTAEAESLERTLHYGASKLPGKKIEEFSERLARLYRSINQLQYKKDRAAKAQAELAELTNKLGDVPTIWKGMGRESQRRFIELITEKVVLTKPALNWLQLRIVWLWPNEPDSICYIWQHAGKRNLWTDEENDTLRRLYPQADRATLLSTFPSRSWKAIHYQASDLGLARTYQFNNSTLPLSLSVNDAAFMEHIGITLEYPHQRVWWIYAMQSNEDNS